MRDLAKVQRQRTWPTRIVQAFQAFLLRQIVAGDFDANQPSRLPLTCNRPGRVMGFGMWPVHVRS